MLAVYNRLFDKLNHETPYAVWKGCHELQIALRGKGDIDLLVDLDSQEDFKNILQVYGFVHASFKSLTFPFIEHYYGYDEETGKICHLHVYYKIITGESHLKSYHIPIENELLRNRFLNSVGLYEVSYTDQALLYTMRHYMKRASLFGFLFWAYEKKDYQEEYAYISKGLSVAGGKGYVQVNNGIRSEFDFRCLDLGGGLAGYLQGIRKNKALSGFRRYSVFRAIWKSLNNFAVRLLYKIFRVRKRLDKGLVLAISGVDGSGKSSMVSELHGYFGKSFDVKIVHLGKPPATLLTFPLRPLLFVYRALKGRHKENSDGSDFFLKDEGVFKKKNGFFWGVRYLVLAYERYQLSLKARTFADKGRIVICDRYPTNSPEKMDSPRIGEGGSMLVEKMRQCEVKLYEHLPNADALIFLDVSRESAISRNRTRIKKDKETDGEIAQRHEENQGLDFCTEQAFCVDANHDYESVLKRLQAIAWGCVLKTVNDSQNLSSE